MKAAVEYVRDTIDLVKQIETRFLELGARLYHIRENKLWQDTYDSYYDFLESAHINQSMASMLYGIHDHFVVKGGKTQEDLRGIGYSNLYKAIPLIESRGVDRALTTAKTLTRGDIEDEVRDEKHGVHAHTIRWRRRHSRSQSSASLLTRKSILSLRYFLS